MNALRYLLHGLTQALAWFVVVNAVASAMVAGVAGRLAARDTAGSPPFWFGVRLFPAAAAMLFVTVLFVPSFWRYEPRELVEGFDITLTSLAAVGVALIAAACARGGAAWWRTARRADAWMRTSRPLDLGTPGIAAFEVDEQTPIMALVGVLRPRLLVTRGLLDVLTREELAASVAHEIGHRRAWDNLKRLAMRAAPDLLTATPVARRIELRWASAAEHSADCLAGDDSPTRCALASALVKIARLTPPMPRVAEPISMLVSDGEIASRVQRLLDDAPSASGRRSVRWLALAIPGVGIALTYVPLLRILHFATEVLVSTLP